MAEIVKIEGLSRFIRSVKKMDADLAKTNRKAMNDAVEIVLGYARPRIPRRTGRAAGSLKAQSTQTSARVAAGGNKAPWYPWLDFGGRVGRGKATRRPFIGEGRYLYPSLAAKRRDFEEAMSKALTDTARAAGLEVT